jgi:two-component system, NarL family, nitrate/nitrite response regulator NarL
MKRTVALVDDHPLMVDGMMQLLSKSTTLQVLAVGTTSNELVDICKKHRPDLFIVDLSLPGDAYEAIKLGAQVSPATKFVAYTASSTVETAIRALDAGAKGYVLKGSTANELLTALQAALNDETYISQAFASRVITALRDASLRRAAAEVVRLSIRENQIVRLLLRGKTNREIALTLKISERTVKHYMTALMQKMQVRNRTEVALAAQKLQPEASAALAH